MADAILTSYADLLEHILTQVRAKTARPFIVGIAGPPATGKSTLASRLVDDLTTTHGLVARHCPMDGFHLFNAELDARKLRTAKGRIETFDAEALLEAAKRLRAREPFWWPAYSRARHEPVAEGVRITGQEEACVIEGNYLLSDAPVWRDVAHLLDLRVFIDAPDDVLSARLSTRHRASGRDPEVTRRKIARVDLPNAQSIREGKPAAEVVINDARCL